MRKRKNGARKITLSGHLLIVLAATGVVFFTFLLQQDFLYLGLLILWVVRLLLLLLLLFEIRTIIRLLGKKYTLTNRIPIFETIYIISISAILLWMILTPQHLVYLRDTIYFNSHQIGFNKILDLAETSDCYGSELYCQENISINDADVIEWLNDEWIYIAYQHERLFIVLANRNKHYQMVYIEG